jgi:hypothetical protein
VLASQHAGANVCSIVRACPLTIAVLGSDPVFATPISNCHSASRFLSEDPRPSGFVKTLALRQVSSAGSREVKHTASKYAGLLALGPTPERAQSI